MNERPPLVFVTVGTEHYAFDRLIDWVDAWLTSPLGTRVQCLVQHGASRPASRCESRPFLTFEEMRAAMGAAIAVVTHGGTGSVILARSSGIVPIVVPRARVHGEHVDDHQVSFARRMAAMENVQLADTQGLLHELLDGVVEGRMELRIRGRDDGSEGAVVRFAQLVDALLVADER